MNTREAFYFLRRRYRRQSRGAYIIQYGAGAAVNTLSLLRQLTNTWETVWPEYSFTLRKNAYRPGNKMRKWLANH